MLQVLIKETFIDSILNSERAFLLYIDKNHKVWLRADMEYGGDPPRYRVELMNFNLDIAKPILYTTVECRVSYCGGICFIEFDAEDTLDLTTNDFINLSDKAVYILCDDKDLAEIAERFSDCFVYVYVRYNNWNNSQQEVSV